MFSSFSALMYLANCLTWQRSRLLLRCSSIELDSMQGSFDHAIRSSAYQVTSACLPYVLWLAVPNSVCSCLLLAR